MKTLAILICSLLSPLGSFAKQAPNIVFFLVDDQSSNTLGCYGNELVSTPTIDGLAKEGTRFANSFVSQPVCWMSRSSLLTGLAGRSLGSRGNPEVVRSEAAKDMYPKLLRQNGYRVGFFGKWHVKMPNDFSPNDYFDAFEIIGRDPYFKTMPDGTLRHETELIMDKGISFLSMQRKDQPFMLNLWFNACHSEDNDRQPGAGHFPWPSSMNGKYKELNGLGIIRRNLENFDSLPEFLKTSVTRERFFWRWNTDQKAALNHQGYLRMVSGVDREIARFLEALEDSGLAGNTIIVYSADNGYLMGNRGLAGKWSHFEDSLRVPLIVKDPRISTKDKGKVVEESVLNLDLPATFLSWAGIVVPSEYQGRSIRPLVEGEEAGRWRTDTFHEHYAVRNRIPAFEGIRNSDFKYARYIDHESYEFLHDLRSDPEELINFADRTEYRGTLEALRRRTDEYVAEMGGPLPAPKSKFRPSIDAYPEAALVVALKTGEDGFASIFNGKNLTGWVGDADLWSVEDGAITGSSDGSLKMNRFLSWKGSTVRNFELRAKVRMTAKGNSGIQYRSTLLPEQGNDVIRGYQCDVVTNHPAFNGMLYEERGRKILTTSGQKAVIDPQGQSWIVGELARQDLQPDTWQEYRIEARGNHLRHWVDGKQTVDVIDLDLKGRAMEGILAFQLHKGPPMKVQFKDIFLKALPDDLPLIEGEEAIIPEGSLGQRPQRRLPKDWKPPIYEKK